MEKETFIEKDFVAEIQSTMREKGFENIEKLLYIESLKVSHMLMRPRLNSPYGYTDGFLYNTGRYLGLKGLRMFFMFLRNIKIPQRIEKQKGWIAIWQGIASIFSLRSFLTFWVLQRKQLLQQKEKKENVSTLQ